MIIKILFTLIIISTQLHASNWMVSISAGGNRKATPESFYQNSLDSLNAAQAFGISTNHQAHFFGGMAPEEGFYRPSKEAVTDVLQLKKKFLTSNPVNCELAPSLYRFFYSFFDKEEVFGDDFAKYNSFNLKNASLEHIDESLINIENQIEYDDHLMINITGHGEFDYDHDAYHVTSGEEQYLNFDILEKQLSTFSSMIHLNVQSCYSGHSQKLSHQNLCVVSATSRSFVGYAHDELFSQTFEKNYISNLGHYGSQLKAFACTLAQNTIDDPQTSLSFVIEQWEDEFEIKTKQIIPALRNLSSKIFLLSHSPFISKERRTLLKKFKTSYVTPYKECTTDRSQEIELLQRLSLCKRILPLPKRQALGRFFRARVASDFDLFQINRHLNFILNASQKYLQRYNDQFDCLSYDFHQ